MIGIIGAMTKEIALLKAGLSVSYTEIVAGMEFYVGRIGKQNVVLVRSGVGKVNAAIAVQVMADIFDVEYIINTGIAGALLPSMEIGDVVLSVDAVQHDVDARIFGYEPGGIPQMPVSIFPSDTYLRKIVREFCVKQTITYKLWEGRVLSGDQFISDADKKNYLVSNFLGCCVEMEGAAIAQTAYLNGIPFLIIRVISDRADGLASREYGEFEEAASVRSSRLVQAVVMSLDENFSENYSEKC